MPKFTTAGDAAQSDNKLYSTDTDSESTASDSCTSKMTQSSSICTEISINNGIEHQNVSNVGANTVATELEELANTNLISVRIQFDDHTSQYNVASDIQDFITANKGYFVNQIAIEEYEYLKDEARLDLLKQNRSIYLFEQGSQEYSKHDNNEEESDDKNEANWHYDVVFQGQFKYFQSLKYTCDAIEDYLNKNYHQNILRWSISINRHALTHPGNLYIKGIPKNLTIDDLLPVFSAFGSILSIKVITDTLTGASLGYGFISYQLGSQASECIEKLNGRIMNGSTLFINYHVERKERERIYWDHFKENTDDKRFRGIFIGNLPVTDSENKLITPDDVVAKFKLELEGTVPENGILSYYFPKQNSNTEVEYKDEEDSGNSKNEQDAETCPSRYEECPLKGYGFIKFSSHEFAMMAIKIFTNYEWMNNKLAVNKAIQNKPHHIYNDKQNMNKAMKNYGCQFYVPYGSPYQNTIIPSYYGTQIPRGIPPSPFMNYLNSPNAGAYSAPFPMESNMISPTMDPYYGMRQFDYIDSLNSSLPGKLQPQPGLYYGGARPLYGVPGVSLNAGSFGFPRPMKDQQESNIYIKHIPLKWKDDDLFEFYKKFGEVISAKVITVGGSKNKTDLKSAEAPIGSSKGYGFVYFKNALDASRAILETDKRKLDNDHVLHVSFAQKRTRNFDDDTATNFNGNHGVNNANGHQRRPSSQQDHNKHRQRSSKSCNVPQLNSYMMIPVVNSK